MLPVPLEIETAVVAELDVDTESEEVEVSWVVAVRKKRVGDHVSVVGWAVPFVEVSFTEEPHLLREGT